ncbi:MAG: aminotransferase class V-fold PLP-dependent enzyme, partial [Microthrixaceae bacterium]|nr:aminotransferase class V-fold PLP-dependent enzyme [Microthrixaceae bacterium]
MVVYLDHAATTPLRPEAREAWLAASMLVGNPSSVHAAGQAARRLLEESRERLAEALECDPIEVVFTSGGTESVNLALKGLFWARAAADASRRGIVAPQGEHHATLDALEWLESHEGAQLRWPGLDALGRLDLDAWDAALGDGTDVALASMLVANNEVGTLQPVSQAVLRAARVGVPLHLDAVGAFGHVPLSFRGLREAQRDSGAVRGAGDGLVAMSVAAHKLGGPAGIGALVVAREATPAALLHGGEQQRGLRSGTQNVPGAAAFAAAAALAVGELEAEAARLR